MELKPDFTWEKGELGEYHQYDVIKSMVMGLIDENSVVLELGAYDGSWTQYFLGAKNSFSWSKRSWQKYLNQIIAPVL